MKRAHAPCGSLRRAHAFRNAAVSQLANEVMTRYMLFAALIAVATSCVPRHSDEEAVAARRAEAARDSGFAGLQARGAAAMGVDQYTSTHVFESLPNKRLRQIRRTSHMHPAPGQVATSQ